MPDPRRLGVKVRVFEIERSDQVDGALAAAISDADRDPPNELLLSYGADFPELIRQSASYVARILWRGANPAGGQLRLQR